MNKHLSRILTACLLLPAAISQAGTDTLDVSDPEQALLASNKLFCDNQPGDVSLFWWQGVVYSRIPGEKDRHLFDVQGVNARQCGRYEDDVRGLGFRSVSREIMLYMDPESGEVLETWDNPWSGETVEVIQVHNDPVNSRAIRWSRDEQGEPSATFDGMTVMDGVALQGGGAARLFYDNPLQGDYQEYEGGKYHASEFLTIAYPMDDALNASKTAIQDAVISWGRVSSWLPWMKMRGRSGVMVHYTHGMRLHDWNELPEKLRLEIETNYPKFTQPPPVNDKRPNETTWTVFKRILDERREREANQ
jgi:uncharacterized protein DUF1838